MNDQRNDGALDHVMSEPFIRQWGKWHCRFFFTLVIVLEVALIAAIVSVMIMLWNMLDFS